MKPRTYRRIDWTMDDQSTNHHHRRWLTISSSSLLLILTIVLLPTPVASWLCVHHQCDCKYISGKLFASCVAADLDQLPECKQEEREQLNEIQAINLTRNAFNRLPPYFFHRACLSNLQKVYLSQVGLQSVDDLAFKPLTNIIDLSLSSNFLKAIPSRSLHGLVRLRSLDLSHNTISEVNNASFESLSSLQTLLLNNNDIHFIDVGAFSGLQGIKIIKLSSNRLTVLQPETFISLPTLHSLYLEDNYWNCNCRMQPFKRMLLLSSQINIPDQPKCVSTSVVWNKLALDNFQCAPTILKNFSDPEVTVSEGSILRLKCAIYTETFGDLVYDEEYLSFSHINWYWNNVLITNHSTGCDHNCHNLPNVNAQHFQINEFIREYNPKVKIKISNLELYSIMVVNEGNYRCSVANNAGSDEMFFRVHVIPYYSNNVYENNKITPAASSSSSDTQISYSKNIVTTTENADHILFGLVLGILCGLFIVLVIFSIVLVVFFRRQKVMPQPHELVMVDASTDNNTVDENHETATETTTEKMHESQTEFNPLLVVNPVQKPPRLGIPDVSSIYSHPSWTIDRANPHNRSRYASYAETEPLYSDYYTLYRHNRLIPKLDTFISDTASEV